MADFSVRIYYEDTDCGGIVYHTNYIKYCERARSEIFFSTHAMPNTQNVGLVVRKLNADFLDSAKLGDLLVVKTQILKLGGSSLTLGQDIFLVDSINAKFSDSPSLANESVLVDLHKSSDLKDEKRIFTCEVKLACIDIKHKKIVRIPSEILAILRAKF